MYLVTWRFMYRVGVMEPADGGAWIRLDSTFEKKPFTIFLLSNARFLRERRCKSVDLSAQIRQVFI
jgi:hypothetical protein